MGLSTRDSGINRQTIDMEEAIKFGQMEAFTRGTGKMTKQMEEAG